jgi:hypothetical protein
MVGLSYSCFHVSAFVLVSVGAFMFDFDVGLCESSDDGGHCERFSVNAFVLVNVNAFRSMLLCWLMLLLSSYSFMSVNVNAFLLVL